VSGVDPPRGWNTGGTPVTLSGANFFAGAQVTFGGSLASDVVVVNATTIRARTPPHSVGPVEVQVIINGRTGSLPTGFTYFLHPAQIMSIIYSLLE
jgi:hypothetical protein